LTRGSPKARSVAKDGATRQKESDFFAVRETRPEPAPLTQLERQLERQVGVRAASVEFSGFVYGGLVDR
jgi:hypothetical protein